MANEFVKLGRIKGLDEINAKLAKLRELGIKPKHLTKIKALNAGAKVIKVDAAARAPVRQSGILHGRSRKALALAAVHQAGIYRISAKNGKQIRMGKALTSLAGSIGSKFTTGATRDALNTRVLVRKPTGHLVEFGHRTKQGKRYGGKSKYYKPKAGGKGSIAARPFIEPAIGATQTQVVDRISEVINKDLDRLLATTSK